MSYQFELFSADFDEPPVMDEPTEIHALSTVGRCIRCGDYIEEGTEFCHCMNKTFCGCHHCEQIGSMLRSLHEEKLKAKYQGAEHAYQLHVKAEIERLQAIPVCEGYRKKNKDRRTF